MEEMIRAERMKEAAADQLKKERTAEGQIQEQPQGEEANSSNPTPMNSSEGAQAENKEANHAKN